MSTGIPGATGAVVATSFFAGDEDEPEQDKQAIAAVKAVAISAFLFISRINQL
jgi:phosphatidylserine synthase